jgi:hypothetical protein
MKRILLFLLFISFAAQAQEDAWVYFNDKPDAEFYLANPLEMLSQRALDRRAAQNIALDEQDVPIHQEYIDAVTATNGITVMAKSKWLNALHIRGTQEVISTLTELVFVDHVEYANKALNPSGKPGRTQKKITQKPQETQSDYNYGQSSTQIEMLNGQLLHQQDYTGTGKIIAVLDAGFPGVDTAQPFARLFENSQILGGHNFVEHSENMYTGGTHGTMVLSTMGGYTEGQLVGTAPDASYYLFVTEDVTSENPVEESYWVEAAERADSLGVDVINTSLGYFDYDNPAYSYTYENIDGETAFITRGANVAFTRGMICVTSAGNSAGSNHPNIGAPADAFNTLAVGAVDAAEQYASFSSIGPSYDMRVKPDVMAMGVADVISDTTGTITTGSGTSFAGPVMAGMVTCLWQALPDKTNQEIIDLVRQSADRYNNPNVQYGYGIPNFSLALENALSTKSFTSNTILVYPNPVKDRFTILLSNTTKNTVITLYNNIGQMVKQKAVSADKNSVSVSELPKGIYSYKITSAQKTVTGKIIKE